MTLRAQNSAKAAAVSPSGEWAYIVSQSPNVKESEKLIIDT